MARLAPLLALTLVVAPACGHKGPPLPPRLHTPPTLADFRLAQRGDALEMSFSAPQASVDGVAFERLDIEIFWGEGFVDLEKEGERRTVRAEPGARIVETVPLPDPGTIVRAAARAVSGRDTGQRSLILALETHVPVAPPHDLIARLRPNGVALNWRGPRPEEFPPPDLGPVAGERPPLGTAPLLGEDPDAPEGAVGLPDEAEALAGAETHVSAPDERPTVDPSASSKAEAAPKATVEEAASGDSGTDEPDRAETAEDGDTEAKAPRARSHGFRVYRRLATLPYGIPLNYEPQERRLLTDTGAPLGTSVCYVIRAVGSTEPLVESAASNEVCLDVRDISPPAPPTGLAVVPRDGGLEVVWSPSSESDLGGYRIYRAVGDAEPENTGEVPAGTTAWLDETPRAGVLYRYTVTAFDSAGNEGPPSGTAQGRGP